MQDMEARIDRGDMKLERAEAIEVKMYSHCIYIGS